MQVVVDGLLTGYVVAGKGSTIVLLHGWGDQAKGLHGLQQALAKQHQVIAVDLPGFGGTEAPKTTWGLDEYAQFVAHFLAKIDAKQVHLLIGHSNGGAIAVRGMAKGWLQADKLVLIASAGIRGTNKGRVGALMAVTKVGKALTMPLPKSIKKKLRQTVYDVAGSDMLVAEHLQDTFKRVVSEDVREDAKQISVPTLLLYGQKDAATPVWYGEAFHEAIDVSVLEILPEAGHFIHIDQAAAVTKAIEEFA